MPDRSLRGPAIADYPSTPLETSGAPAMRAVLEKILRVAPTPATVLLTGETGVGKGTVARLIHHWSGRREMPFIAVHCGALSDTLLETELFGHEKGSFTGAHRRKQGKFELADGGTLFLDEVGTMPPAAQIRLLDVLQERTVHRVGGEEDVRVDVRVVAASNSDLRRMQADGSFRVDLFHRLNVFPVEIPPLRERTEDLPELVARLLRRLNRLYAKSVVGLDPLVERAFMNYAWPGNVRELENVLERAHILESAPHISSRNVPLEIIHAAGPQVAAAAAPGSAVSASKTLADVRHEAVAVAEYHYLIGLLRAHQGRIDSSARTAGITTRQLRKLLARHKIRKQDFKAGDPGATSRT